MKQFLQYCNLNISQISDLDFNFHMLRFILLWFTVIKKRDNKLKLIEIESTLFPFKISKSLPDSNSLKALIRVIIISNSIDFTISSSGEDLKIQPLLPEKIFLHTELLNRTIKTRYRLVRHQSL